MTTNLLDVVDFSTLKSVRIESDRVAVSWTEERPDLCGEPDCTLPHAVITNTVGAFLAPSPALFRRLSAHFEALSGGQ